MHICLKCTQFLKITAGNSLSAPMLILCYFEYTTVLKKYQGMKLLQIAVLGLQLLTQLKPQFKAVSLIKVCVIMLSFITILSEIPFVYVHEK